MKQVIKTVPLPPEYPAHPGYVAVPLADGETIPDNYFIGDDGPPDLSGMTYSESDPIYWFDQVRNRVCRVAEDLSTWHECEFTRFVVDTSQVPFQPIGKLVPVSSVVQRTSLSSLLDRLRKTQE